MNAASALAQAASPPVRLDTPSGLPVPRFVSLKTGETNCRIGPSFEHPVRFVYKRAGAPVMVVAESVDHWRKVRDAEGAECWAHQTTLRAVTHVLALEETVLRRRPGGEAEISARLEAGVLARIEKRDGGWIRVAAGPARGWVPSDAVWGGERFAAPRK
jgi:SH3-like domain-containing protein